MSKVSTEQLNDIAKMVLECRLGSSFYFPIQIEKIIPYGLIVTEVDFFDMYKDSVLTLKQERYEQRNLKVTTISRITIRRILATPEKFAGTIFIQKNLDQATKRFAIAYEYARFLLKTLYDTESIGLTCDLEPNLGLYDFTSENDFLASELARALLLPYELVCQEKTKYQSQSIHLPIDYSDWIIHLRDLAQMPEYQVVLGYEAIRKRKTKELTLGENQ